MVGELEVLRIVSERLESLGLRYMLTGSFAMAFYATPRMTRDLDIIVALEARDVPRVASAFAVDFYVDEDAAREAVRDGRLFNLMHLGSGIKVDIIVRKDDPYRRLELDRRQRAEVEGLCTWVVSREDLILSKLVWGRLSGSELQRRDVRALGTGIDDRGRTREHRAMNDTSEKVAAMVAARHAAMSVEERVRAASSMYDAARSIVEASIPADVQGARRRYEVLKRFYGGDLPDAALRACSQASLEST